MMRTTILPGVVNVADLEARFVNAASNAGTKEQPTLDEAAQAAYVEKKVRASFRRYNDALVSIGQVRWVHGSKRHGLYRKNTIGSVGE